MGPTFKARANAICRRGHAVISGLLAGTITPDAATDELAILGQLSEELFEDEIAQEQGELPGQSDAVDEPEWSEGDLPVADVPERTPEMAW